MGCVCIDFTGDKHKNNMNARPATYEVKNIIHVHMYGTSFLTCINDANTPPFTNPNIL